jgi:hypothetical protein
MTINSASWWANKLGAQQPQQPQRYGIVLDRQQPQPVQQPVHVPQPVTPVQAGGRQDVLDPNRAPSEEVSMGEAMRLWRGGEAHRMEGHLQCPDCGSTTGYTAYSGRAAGAARVNGQQPRPHCFECGYNGSFSQGLESNWG